MQSSAAPDGLGPASRAQLPLVAIAEAMRPPRIRLGCPSALSRCLPPRTKAVCHENAQARGRPFHNLDVASTRRKVSEGRLAGLGEAHICSASLLVFKSPQAHHPGREGGGEEGRVEWRGGGWEGCCRSEMQISGGLTLGVPRQMALILFWHRVSFPSWMMFSPQGPGHVGDRRCQSYASPTAAPWRSHLLPPPRQPAAWWWQESGCLLPRPGGARVSAPPPSLVPQHPESQPEKSEAGKLEKK